MLFRSLGIRVWIWDRACFETGPVRMKVMEQMLFMSPEVTHVPVGRQSASVAIYIGNYMRRSHKHVYEEHPGHNKMH